MSHEHRKVYPTRFSFRILIAVAIAVFSTGAFLHGAEDANESRRELPYINSEGGDIDGDMINSTDNRDIFLLDNKTPYNKIVLQEIGEYIEHLYFYNLYYGTRTTGDFLSRDVAGLTLGRRLNTSYVQTALEVDYFMEPEFNLKRELVMMLGGYFSTSFVFLENFSMKLKFGVLGNPKKSYSLKKLSTAIFVGKNLYSPQETFSPYGGVIFSNSAKTYIVGIGKSF